MGVADNSCPRYIINPDVVLRKEGSEGALLFNPDTDQMSVLNQTALFILNLCDGTHDLAGIVAAMMEAYEDTPEDQVAEQIVEYIEDMSSSGFIDFFVD